MKRRLSLAAFVIITAVAIWNAPLTYRMGIDCVVYEKKIPLYAKACGFLYRDWMYKDIVRDIVVGKKTDEDKALAIMRWTVSNVRRGVPSGVKIVDDHPLNIIIRQYGADDQLEDVFTILCSYAGMYGGMKKCYNKDRSEKIILSFVRARNARWLLFDVSNNKYFVNTDGMIASIEDYFDGRLILSEEDVKEYGEFLEDIKNINLSAFTRAWEQMPFRRIPAELKKLLTYEKAAQSA